jgi:maltose O-acetyltransferase
MRGHLVRRLLANRPCRLRISPGVSIRGAHNVSLGEDVAFERLCCIEAGAGVVVVGSRTGFNYGVWIGSDHGRIVIGSNVIVGPYAVFRAANHRFDGTDKEPIRELGHNFGEIVVGDNVWIGSHVTLLAGANIGANCVIGAGAVVRDTIPPNSLAVGTPAKVVRQVP